MSKRDVHIQEETLQEYLDRRITGKDLSRVRDHLEACTRCMQAFSQLSEIDVAIRNAPLEYVGAGFTTAVMERIDVSPKTPLVNGFSLKFAYVIGLTILLGGLGTFLVFTGVMGGDTSVAGEGGIQRAALLASEAISNWIVGAAVWMSTYFHFALDKGSISISVTACLVVAFIGLIDKLALRKVVHEP